MGKKRSNKVGYARVSTGEQNIQMQIDALQEAGCIKIFQDIASGAKSKRDGLEAALSYTRPGDTLVVWKLDRLGRSMKHLIEIMNELESHEISFCSLQEGMDTTSIGGKLIFHVFSALADFERSLIKERTQTGLKSARVRGRFGGRPKKLNEKQVAMAKSLMADPSNTVKDVCKTLGIGKSTLYRYLESDRK
jgi:DNA invertase Pin-like site-specific DNA recombinase